MLRSFKSPRLALWVSVLVNSGSEFNTSAVAQQDDHQTQAAHSAQRGCTLGSTGGELGTLLRTYKQSVLNVQPARPHSGCKLCAGKRSCVWSASATRSGAAPGAAALGNGQPLQAFDRQVEGSGLLIAHPDLTACKRTFAVEQLGPALVTAEAPAANGLPKLLYGVQTHARRVWG